MKVQVTTLGAKLSIETSNGESYGKALKSFAKLAGKIIDLEAMDVYADGRKVTNLDEEISDGTREITAIKSKHESAAFKVKVQALGASLEVECDGESGTCSEVVEVFQTLSQKLMDGMDYYKNGEKVVDPLTERMQNGDNLVAIKSKHESAN